MRSSLHIEMSNLRAENTRLRQQNEELQNQIKAYLLEQIAYRASIESNKPIEHISTGMRKWYSFRGIFK